MGEGVRNLSSFNKFNTGLEERWQIFLEKRKTRLTQESRFGFASEKVAENILEDFFTVALDWELRCINNQIQFADMVITHLGLKQLIIEVKRPNSLSWNKSQLERALEQAYRYAQEQRVNTIAVSDGTLLYAVDLKNGGLEDRVRLHLDTCSASPDLWWLSTDGIYRPAKALSENITIEGPVSNSAYSGMVLEADAEKLHPKYHIPARCFAYVGDLLKTSTWKLPYKTIDGRIDLKHLPGAIRAVITNYRGAHITSIPEDAIPDVLVRLGKAAWETGEMPGQIAKPLETYNLLYQALYQLGRLDEIKQI
jgi:hypothetical protein